MKTKNYRRTTRCLSAYALSLVVTIGLVHAQLPEIECAANPLVPNQVQVTWPDVPTEDTIASLPSTNATLLLTNRSNDALQYRLMGRLQAAGEQRRVQLGTGILPPLGTGLETINFQALGIDISDLDFSGRLFIEVRSEDSSAALVDRAYSPTVFFHTAAGPTGGLMLFMYGGEARRTQFNYGDLHYQLRNSSVPDPTLLGIFDGGAGLGRYREGYGGEGGGIPPQTPGSLGAPPRWEFCMRWVYQSIDSGFGEDYYTSGSLMKARGMKVIVDHANWTQPRTFFCNDINGCFSFASDENMGFEVTVFAEARLGGDDNVTVRGFDTIAQANVNNPDQTQKWIFTANPGGTPRRVYYQSGAGDMASLMAFGSFVFHWVDHKTSPRLAGDRDLLLVTESCQGGSCQSGDQVRMKPGDSNRKFLVGHEVGHWLHRQWTNDQMGYDNATWSANSGDPECAFAGVGSHAMRSKEYAVGGFIEGTAHYLAALAWNNHDSQQAIFKYYKEIDDAVYSDMAADNWIVEIEGQVGALGGTTNWMENECFVSDGHSVEMDWMRFWWDYRTNPGVGPNHYDIFDLISFTSLAYPWANNFGVYDQLATAIQDAGLGQLQLVNRFETLASWNGVAQ
ncbi:MAG: hypothetical protein ACI841_004857 [Planctomycetota bacterium]|jgi:hypothetical protein